MFERQCPQCQASIHHKNEKALYYALKRNGVCRKCASKNSGFTGRYATKGKNVGKDNAFYGKRHTQESKDKITKDKDWSPYRTKEFREKISHTSKGKNNPMYGRKVYDIWVEKYGEERAKELEQEWKNKLSKHFSGPGNTMFGKPTPKKAGNGWKGYYNGKFFRSLRELTYIVEHLEKHNKEWISAEAKAFRILYEDYTGKQRNYFADFVVDGNTLVEVKPAKLIGSPLVSLKEEAARKWCEAKGWKFEIIDPGILSIEKLKELLDNQQLIFLNSKHTEYIQNG